MNKYFNGELELMSNSQKKTLFTKLKANKVVTAQMHTDETNFLNDVLLNKFNDYLSAYINTVEEKSFKYSSLFKINTPKTADVYKTIQSISTDLVTINGFTNPLVPWRLSDNQLSFSFLISGINFTNNVTGIVHTVYTMITTVLEVENELFLQIDLDNLPIAFRRNEDTFFNDKIALIKDYLEGTFNWEIEGLDLSLLLDQYRVQNTVPKLAAQKMILSTGGQATLDSSISKDIVLPIIGELKALLDENEAILNKCSEVRKLLLDFIETTEAEADIPWSTFIWEAKTKSKSIQIKFILNSNFDYTLLNYYAHTNGRGGMEDVTRKIIKEYLAI